MKQASILFKPWKVRKILGWDWSAGPMQTRRLIEPKPFEFTVKVVPGPVEFGNVTYGEAGDWIQASAGDVHVYGLGKCRYGTAGDLLWVKETWTRGDNGYLYKATHSNDEPHPRWKSSLYMPKEATRIWLEVVDVRAERLNVITPEDVLAEGIEKTKEDDYWLAPLAGTRNFPWHDHWSAFASRWGEINTKPGTTWNDNPWVWVVTYKLYEKQRIEGADHEL